MDSTNFFKMAREAYVDGGEVVQIAQHRPDSNLEETALSVKID
jgi:hypothetical protein